MIIVIIVVIIYIYIIIIIIINIIIIIIIIIIITIITLTTQNQLWISRININCVKSACIRLHVITATMHYRQTCRSPFNGDAAFTCSSLALMSAPASSRSLSSIDLVSAECWPRLS